MTGDAARKRRSGLPMPEKSTGRPLLFYVLNGKK
jgi:hypothetical protein